LCAECFWRVFEVGALCFAYHLDRAEVFGFNPYEDVPVRLRHPISEAERKKVKDNLNLS